MEGNMSNKSEHVKKWRRTVKETIIKSMGGKCCICSYNKCDKALELHHLDPALKEFSFGEVMSRPKSWNKIIIELRKCVLVCSNCHKEVHNEMTKIPENIPKFNETYADYNNRPKAKTSPCVVCGKMKPSYNITCSKECRAKRSRTVDWDKIDIEKLLKEGNSFYQIGDLLGVSVSAVSKRLKRIIKVRNGENAYRSKQDPKAINV
jgi:hypothetical protein